MFFNTEEEKTKFLEQQEKEKKKYEKIEKKLFLDVNLIPLEIDENPSKDLRAVLFANREDLCRAYLETLPMNKSGEDTFVKVFDFIFNDENQLINSRNSRLLIDDFKSYLALAIDKRYVLGIDSVINFFEKKFEIVSPMKFLLMSSIVENNHTLLDFLFLKTGENNKKANYYISPNIFFADPKNLSNILNTLNLRHYEFENFEIAPYKKCAFKKDEFINIFISRCKVFMLEVKELKKSDINIIKGKFNKILDVFQGMDEETVRGLVYSFQDKKEAHLLFSFVTLFNQIYNPEIWKEKKDLFYIFENSGNNVENIVKPIFYLQKSFLEFAETDQKIELINKSFSNLSKFYNANDLEQITKFERKQMLANTISKQSEMNSNSEVNISDDNIKIIVTKNKKKI